MSVRKRRARIRREHVESDSLEFTDDVARVLASAHADGYRQGFFDGRESARRHFEMERQMIFHQARMAAQQSGDVERARIRGYEQGFAAGKSAVAPKPQGINKSAALQEFLSKASDACRVIAESNPNMAPGVNAVKRQISKIKLD